MILFILSVVLLLLGIVSLLLYYNDYIFNPTWGPSFMTLGIIGVAIFIGCRCPLYYETKIESNKAIYRELKKQYEENDYAIEAVIEWNSDYAELKYLNDNIFTSWYIYDGLVTEFDFIGGNEND